MSNLRRFELATETERELNVEYNRLKNEAHQKAREVIIHCPSNLKSLVIQSSIDAKLIEVCLDSGGGKTTLLGLSPAPECQMPSYVIISEKSNAFYMPHSNGIPDMEMVVIRCQVSSQRYVWPLQGNTSRFW